MTNEKALGADAAEVDEACPLVPASTASHVAHTPGPWGFENAHIENGAFVNPRIVSLHPNHLYLRIVDIERPDVPRRGADAVLICSAPDLLASVKELREASAMLMRFIADRVSTEAMLSLSIEMESAGLNGFGVRAQAVIAKAEGR